MKVTEIKHEIAIKNNCNPEKIKCYYCKNWGYNNGKVLNNCCESKCLKNRGKTCASNYCKDFKIKG